MKNVLKIFNVCILLVLFVERAYADEVNIYTSRHYDSDPALYAEFTEKTGIRVNIVSGKGNALLERLKAEGKNSQLISFLPWMRVIYGEFKARVFFSRLSQAP